MTTFADQCWQDRNWTVKDASHLESRPVRRDPLAMPTDAELLAANARWAPIVAAQEEERRAERLRTQAPGQAGGLSFPWWLVAKLVEAKRAGLSVVGAYQQATGCTAATARLMQKAAETIATTYEGKL